MWNRIKSILKKEFLQVLRDPRMKVVIFISPMIQLLVFGYAATMDVIHIPTAVLDYDNTKQSRDIIREFSYSKYFRIKCYLENDRQQTEVIDGSKVMAVIRIDPHFGEYLMGNRSASLQIVVDGSDSNTAQVVIGYANTIVTNYNNKLLRERARVYLKRKNAYPQIDLRDRRWFNDNLISKNYYLPGVIALIVTIMSLLLTSMAIVREKEIGTMEQLVVSPIRPIELILGKIIPFGIIALTEVLMITLVSVFWFHIPIRGSLLLLVGSTIVYLLTTLGVGLFISTVSSTQQEAVMSVFLFYSPCALLSGFAYPVANMPQIIQVLAHFNPLMYFLVIMRGIFLKGVGISILWPQLLALLVMGVTIIMFSARRFQKNLG